MIDSPTAQTAWPLLLTAAGIGALVSSVGTLMGQYWERRARRREMLLPAALGLAKELRAHSRLVAERRGLTLNVQDDVVSAATYYQWLNHLLDHGVLPDDPRLTRIQRDTDGNDVP